MFERVRHTRPNVSRQTNKLQERVRANETCFVLEESASDGEHSAHYLRELFISLRQLPECVNVVEVKRDRKRER
jgi:hypothetical protein